MRKDRKNIHSSGYVVTTGNTWSFLLRSGTNSVNWLNQELGKDIDLLGGLVWASVYDPWWDFVILINKERLFGLARLFALGFIWTTIFSDHSH